MKKIEGEHIYTACRETGDFIDKFDTIEEAKEAIKQYEEQDKEEGTFSDDFYDIVDENHCSIMDKRGGSRPNSGRKPNGEQPRVAISCRVEKSTADWLKAQGTVGTTIDRLVQSEQKR